MKSLRLFALAAFTALVSGCGNPPEACFVPDLTLAEKGETIIFDNCSLFTDGASWDFGDGTTSTEYDPRKAYNSVGEFLAVLTVEDEKGTRSDNHSEIIKIGDRMLSYIDVTALPANNGSGTPWDGVGDPADVQLYFKRSSSTTWETNTPENTNLSNSVPFLWDMSSSFFEFTYEPWDFMLVDNDGGTVDTMATWTVDLDTVYSARTIPLGGGGFDLKVRYILQ